MTYDYAKYGISYQNYFLIPIWSMHDRNFARVVRKSHGTVLKTLKIRGVLKDHFEMALYRIDPYHTIAYRMHVYRTVRNRAVLKSNQYVIFARIMAKHLSTYRAVRYSTVRHRGRYVEARCTVRDKTARANFFCGGSRSQAHAQFRYQIILRVGDRTLPIIG